MIGETIRGNAPVPSGRTKMNMCRASNLFASIAALSFVVAAWADCKLPPAPAKIPDGNLLTIGKWSRQLQTLKRYNIDSAIEGLERTAEKFNSQISLQSESG